MVGGHYLALRCTPNVRSVYVLVSVRVLCRKLLSVVLTVDETESVMALLEGQLLLSLRRGLTLMLNGMELRLLHCCEGVVEIVLGMTQCCTSLQSCPTSLLLLCMCDMHHSFCRYFI